MGLTFEIKDTSGTFKEYQIVNDGASFGALFFQNREKTYVRRVNLFADLFFEEILQHFIEDVAISNGRSVCVFWSKQLTYNQKEILLKKGAKRTKVTVDGWRNIDALELQV